MDPLSSILTGFKGMRKEKKIPLWLRSNVVDPALMDANSNNEALEKKGLTREMYKARKHQTGKHTLGERKHLSKISKGSKSFSHELGPKGGICLIHPRPHSFVDLKQFMELQGLHNSQLQLTAVLKLALVDLEERHRQANATIKEKEYLISNLIKSKRSLIERAFKLRAEPESAALDVSSLFTKIERKDKIENGNRVSTSAN
ncbi:hypothetical protein POM88_035446 [Heracleum sosnowskyi]|uniref:Uncharacterized protein n=1 Tax=Heracleum sosnowskyi TaxID=360622 RepID=A0AAD8HLG1_9APIA|nr:hypothetical protein POM88_035446 [Heracleum sosnowskyi]